MMEYLHNFDNDLCFTINNQLYNNHLLLEGVGIKINQFVSHNSVVDRKVTNKKLTFLNNERKSNLL